MAISKSSLEWWKENPDAAIEIKAIPVWIGVDIAGALISGAVSASIQAVTNDGQINWGVVGASACAGAVVGKLGKWISKLL